MVFVLRRSSASSFISVSVSAVTTPACGHTVSIRRASLSGMFTVMRRNVPLVSGGYGFSGCRAGIALHYVDVASALGSNDVGEFRWHDDGACSCVFEANAG